MGFEGIRGTEVFNSAESEKKQTASEEFQEAIRELREKGSFLADKLEGMTENQRKDFEVAIEHEGDSMYTITRLETEQINAIKDLTESWLAESSKNKRKNIEAMIRKIMQE